MRDDIPAAFTAARRRWGGNGSGSTAASTARLLQQLPALFSQHKIRRVIDLGCGDVSWFAPLALELESYLGVDVVPAVIDENRRRHPKLTFQVVAGPSVPLPGADLVICRDCLAHLPNRLVDAVILQAALAAPLLLATTFARTQANIDIVLGGYRPLNLQRKPFELGPPIAMLEDSDHKTMALWRR
jgi:SAM-dependent methyltransferase